MKSDVENAKKTLSQSTSATIFVSNYLEDADGEPVEDITISRDTFESLIRPLVQRTIDLIEELLSKTSLSANDISNILLVGGSSCIPLVKRMLVDKYGEERVQQWIEDADMKSLWKCMVITMQFLILIQNNNYYLVL